MVRQTGKRAKNGDILYSNDSVNGNWTYTYDDMNRLTKGVCTANCPAAQGMTYSYDRFGNRWFENVTAGSEVQPQYYFNANNQIDVSGVLYDAAGNVTNDGASLSHSYFYDAENRIIQVNGTMGQCSTAAACYVYDAEGHRVRATVNGQTRDFIYDLSGRNIDEFTPGGSGWLGTWTRGEAYAGSLHIATYANGTTEFDNSDWLSTFRARSDVTGNRIETCTSLPFGEDLTCTGTEVTPIHFTGKERDTESGNDFFEARYYTSTMGRFLTPDWAEKPTNVPYAHFGNPQSLNLYSYVQNNPSTVGDPDGHDGGGPDASWQTDPKAKANGVAQNASNAAAAPALPLAACASGGCEAAAAAGVSAADAAASLVLLPAAAMGVVIVGPLVPEQDNMILDALTPTYQPAPALDSSPPPSTSQQGTIDSSPMAAHNTGERESTREDHEKGEARAKRDQGGEKGDKARRDKGMWPRRPPGGKQPKGGWPPKDQE